MKTLIGVILAGLMVVAGAAMAFLVVGALMVFSWIAALQAPVFTPLVLVFNPMLVFYPITLWISPLLGAVGGWFWSRGLFKP